MKRPASEESGPDHAQPTVAAEDDAARYSPPSVSIVIEFEGRPQLVWDARTDQQFLRLRDWISSRPELEEIVARAILASPAFLERVFGEEESE